MRKFLSAILATTMVVTLATGCSKGYNTASSDNASSNAGTQTTEELSISFWDGNWNEESFKKIEPLWNAQYPNIKLKPEFQVDGMDKKYMLALKNGTAPDVMACAIDWVTTFGNAGLLAPLDEYIAADKVDTSKFVKGAIDASTIDGKLYGLPFRTETYALIYNKDLLAAAGYNEAPKTWDEVIKVAEACTKDGVSGYGLVGTNYGNYSFQYITMLRSSGGDILNADNTQSALNSEAALQTAQLYKNLKPYAPASLMENDNVANRTLFASGKVAMYMSGMYDIPEIIKANPNLNIGCAMVPTANGAERKSILGGWSVAIPKDCKNIDAAWKFVNFLTSPEVAALYTNTFTGTGTPADVFSTIDPAIVQPNADALQYAQALPTTPNIVGIRQAIFDNLVLTLTDSASVEDAMKDLDTKVNELVAVK